MFAFFHTLIYTSNFYPVPFTYLASPSRRFLARSSALSPPSFLYIILYNTRTHWSFTRNKNRHTHTYNVIGPRFSTERPVNCVFASTMTQCIYICINTTAAPFILYANSLRSHHPIPLACPLINI